MNIVIGHSYVLNQNCLTIRKFHLTYLTYSPVGSIFFPTSTGQNQGTWPFTKALPESHSQLPTLRLHSASNCSSSNTLRYKQKRKKRKTTQKQSYIKYYPKKPLAAEQRSTISTNTLCWGQEWKKRWRGITQETVVHKRPTWLCVPTTSVISLSVTFNCTTAGKQIIVLDVSKHREHSISLSDTFLRPLQSFYKFSFSIT